jgi:uncharacterized protein YejL (UPF0352 family)
MGKWRLGRVGGSVGNYVIRLLSTTVTAPCKRVKAPSFSAIMISSQ